MKTGWIVLCCPIVNFRGTHPSQWSFVPPTAVMFLWQDIRLSLLMSRLDKSDGPARQMLAPLSGNMGRVTAEDDVELRKDISADISVILSDVAAT